jgi:hypothetical protein
LAIPSGLTARTVVEPPTVEEPPVVVPPAAIGVAVVVTPAGANGSTTGTNDPEREPEVPEFGEANEVKPVPVLTKPPPKANGLVAVPARGVEVLVAPTTGVGLGAGVGVVDDVDDIVLVVDDDDVVVD